MHGYHQNIEKAVVANDYFRQVLYTGKYSQLVLMSLAPNEEIGQEIHPDNDQFFRFEQGDGRVTVDGHEYLVADGDVVIVPAGAEHNVINASDTRALKLYTLYSPPHHKDGIVRSTRADAEANEQEFDGQTSE